MDIYEKFHIYKYEKMRPVINEQNTMTCQILIDMLMNAYNTADL